MTLRRLVRGVRERLGWYRRALASDRAVLRRGYERTFGEPWPRTPRRYQEKIHWLMVHHRQPVLTQCADRVGVRDFTAARGGTEILNEIFGVWRRAEAIDFAALPSAFALKVAWGWNMQVLCRDKAQLDQDAARRQLRRWLDPRQNTYWRAREWPYKHVPARILGERYLGDNPIDYKVFCFGGVPGFIQVDTDRFVGHKRDCYLPDWTPAPFRFEAFPPIGRPVARPKALEAMLHWAARLSAGFPFVRVDLYEIDGRTVFGEMTWYPGAGAGRFFPSSFDEYWGERIALP